MRTVKIDGVVHTDACDVCGMCPATHRGAGDLCCACYVRAGNPPADWHSECMAEYQRRQARDPVGDVKALDFLDRDRGGTESLRDLCGRLERAGIDGVIWSQDYRPGPDALVAIDYAIGTLQNLRLRAAASEEVERQRLLENITDMRTRDRVYDAENCTSVEEEIRSLVSRLLEADGIDKLPLAELRELHQELLKNQGG